MYWNYGSLYGNCWKFGKFSLAAIALGMTWKLSQMMFPALVLSTGNFQTPLLVGLDLGWIPLGECTSLSQEKCSLVIRPLESAKMYLKMTALVYWEMGQKGFPESDLMLAREPRMYLLKVSHFQV
jgi:hypothetical protein